MAIFEYHNENERPANAIVRRVAGPSTGDVVLITADGSRWLVVPSHPTERATGERRGVHDNRYVYDV